MNRHILLILISVICLQFNTNAQSNRCPVACKEEVKVFLDPAITAKLFPTSFLESTCEGDFMLTIKDLDDNTIFGLAEEVSWKIGRDNIDNSYTFQVEDKLSNSSCFGSVSIVDIHTPIPDGEVIFSDNHIFFPVGGESETTGCNTLACLDHITAAVNQNGSVEIWAQDFLESFCDGELKLTIKDENENLIFEQMEEPYWSVNKDIEKKTYFYLVEHVETENSCWGNITISEYIEENDQNGGISHGPNPEDNVHVDSENCNEKPLDFSSFDIEATLEYSEKTIEEINDELFGKYAIAFDKILVDNQILNVIAGFSFSDEIEELENGDINVTRTFTLIDWCHFIPHSDENVGIMTFVQHISIKNLKDMFVSNVNFGESTASVSINNMKLENNVGQSALVQMNSTESLGSSIRNTIETQGWEDGSYKIEVDKYEPCHESVSSIDLVQTLRHIIGLSAFDSNIKKVAADIDDNGKITAADMVKMRKIILGLDDCGNQSNWSFYKSELNLDKDFELANLNVYDLNYAVNSDNSDVNIVALKKGDVNLSSLEDESELRSLDARLLVDNQKVIAGEIYDIALKINSDIEVISGTVKIENGPFEIVDFSSKSLDIKIDNYHITPEKSALVYYQTNPILIESGEEVLTIKIKATEDTTIKDLFNTNGFEFEIYSSVDSRRPVGFDIDIVDPIKSTNQLISYNAFMNQGVLNIIPATITDSNIQSVHIFTIDGKQLYSSQNLNVSELKINLVVNESLLLAYRIVTDQGQIDTGKFISK